jgi:hypothetical protein
MIEVGTKVKVKKTEEDIVSNFLDDWWFEKMFEVSRITSMSTTRYYVNGLYFEKDELEVYSENEFPEYYI